MTAPLTRATAPGIPLGLDDLLAGAAAVTLQPFDPRALAFIDTVSHGLLTDPAQRGMPELVALGYAFRPAAVARMRAEHARLAGEGLLRPRGLAFHVAPANVDTVFVYVWFIALLCGNRNIVRLSQRASPLRDALVSVLAKALEAHPDIARANALVHYGHDEGLNAALSTACDLRVVWGGDATARHFRALPLAPLATELIFPDRQGWTLLDAAAVAALEDAALGQLAHAFCNDAFWFGQQACASPRAVLWVGATDACGRARARFWPAVAQTCASRGWQPAPAEVAALSVAAHRMAAEGAVHAATPPGHWPVRLTADAFPAAWREAHCGYGLFVEVERPALEHTGALFAPADQTVTTFGFSRAALAAWLAGLPDRAVDRVVPVGEALQFDTSWDGHALWLACSRRVTLRAAS